MGKRSVASPVEAPRHGLFPLWLMTAPGSASSALEVGRGRDESAIPGATMTASGQGLPATVQLVGITPRWPTTTPKIASSGRTGKSIVSPLFLSRPCARSTLYSTQPLSMEALAKIKSSFSCVRIASSIFARKWSPILSDSGANQQMIPSVPGKSKAATLPVNGNVAAIRVWRCRESNPGPNGRTRQASTCVAGLLASRSCRLLTREARQEQRLVVIYRADTAGIDDGYPI
jgi:hypothetical protein